jgi:ankyrin repeat protein
MARMLIEEGASLGHQPDADDDIGPELIEAAAFGHQAWLIEMQVAKGADVRIVNKNGDGLLILSLYTESMDPGPESNSAATTKALLAAGADPNTAGRGGYTPLHWAAHHGKVEEIRMLLGKGAALEAQSEERATPLAVAVERCQPDAVAVLLSYKASRSVLTPRGLRLSEGACAYGYPAITRPEKDKILALLSRTPS